MAFYEVTITVDRIVPADPEDHVGPIGEHWMETEAEDGLDAQLDGIDWFHQVHRIAEGCFHITAHARRLMA